MAWHLPAVLPGLRQKKENKFSSKLVQPTLANYVLVLMLRCRGIQTAANPQSWPYATVPQALLNDPQPVLLWTVRSSQSDNSISAEGASYIALRLALLVRDRVTKRSTEQASDGQLNKDTHTSNINDYSESTPVTYVAAFTDPWNVLTSGQDKTHKRCDLQHWAPSWVSQIWQFWWIRTCQATSFICFLCYHCFGWSCII